jgi:hypothetical protein
MPPTARVPLSSHRGKSSSPASNRGGKASDRSGSKRGGAAAGAKGPTATPLPSVAESAPGAADEDGSAGPTPASRPSGRPLPSSLKAHTSGATGVVDFLSESNEPPLPPKLAKKSSTTMDAVAAAAAADNGSDDAPPPRQVWTAIRWLEEVENLEGCLAGALCTDSRGETLNDEAALELVRAIESREALIERLLANGAVNKLADAICVCPPPSCRP